MSDILAICFLVLLGAAILWSIYSRLARNRNSKKQRGKVIPSMTNGDIRKIEGTLNVELPPPCAAFLTSPRPSEIDEVTISADPDQIIQWTQQQRNGFGGAHPWPPEFVCLGDESDACPYALNCSTGALIRTDHGALEKNPWPAIHPLPISSRKNAPTMPSPPDHLPRFPSVDALDRV